MIFNNPRVKYLFSPPARVTPKNGVSNGTAVTLNCDLSHPVPGVTFGWRHETSDRDVTNQSSFTLSFTPEHVGTWMCVLYGGSGRVITTISQTITAAGSVSVSI